MDKAFVIQQIGAKDSPERKRADEIYNFIIAPVVREAGLEPYRADLDNTPGAITPKMLGELLAARLVIADLTGRNPNVFYELGITHSFARPLVSIADAVTSLPFDAKDERIIALGNFPPDGLGFAQGEQAKSELRESVKLVLTDGYTPDSPLKETAANRSVDDLAPDNPIAAELAQMREALEEIRKTVRPRTIRTTPPDVREDLKVLREVVLRNLGYLDQSDFNMLVTQLTSTSHDEWAGKLQDEWESSQKSIVSSPGRRRPSPPDDSWDESSSTKSQDSDDADEPPF